MKRFFQTIKLSLTSRAFYQRILNGSEPMGFKYFFWLNALYAVILAIWMIPIVFMLTSPEVHAKMLAAIPADLTVTLDKGKTSINQPEPYIIPGNTEEVKQKCNGDQACLDKKPTNAIVIDTKTPFSLEQFENYKTVVLVKDTMIVGRKSSGQIEIIENPKDLHLELNRSWAGNIISTYAWIAWFIPLLVFIGSATVLYVLSLLAYLLWALVIWVLLRIYRIKTTYSRSYSIVLYMSALMLLIEAVSFFIPFLSSVWFKCIVVAIFLYQMLKKGDVTTTETKPATESVSANIISDDDTNNGVK